MLGIGCSAGGAPPVPGLVITTTVHASLPTFASIPNFSKREGCRDIQPQSTPMEPSSRTAAHH